MTTLTVNGIEIYYRDTGQGPPVILVQSSASTGGQWNALAEALAPRFRVLAPDLIGYGRSGAWPEGRDDLIEDEAAILLALARLAGTPAHLVGHSWGGAVTTYAAVRAPELVRSLTLIEPVLYHVLPAAGEHAAFAELETIGRMERDGIAQGRELEVAERFVGYFMSADAWAQMPAERRAGVAKAVRVNALEWADWYAGHRASVAEIQALDLPMLLLGFGRSPHAFQRQSAVLQQMLPRAEAVQLPGLGHMAPATDPNAVNPTIIDFLDRQTLAPAGGEGAERQRGE